MKFEKYFDHTILNPDASEADVERVCREAVENDFASVCVNPYRTAQVADSLKGTGVLTCTVVGFPLGASLTEVKVFETECAVRDGAEEIDMVLNIGAMKDKNYEYVLNDIAAVKKACGSAILKVILETCVLDDNEKKKACELAVEAGADFVKTSTGFLNGSAATVHDVALMKDAVNGMAKVKASGGIRDYGTALNMIEAGADRLGTSRTIAIINQK